MGCQSFQEILLFTLTNPLVTHSLAVKSVGANPIQYINMGSLNSNNLINKKTAFDFFAIHILQIFLNLCFFKLP